jgi:CheY-like chemotaxis protein
MTQSLPPKNIVLYADDDADDLEMVRESFQQYKLIHLITFTNGNSLLQYAQQLLTQNILPCLVILDVNMPGMSGKQTLKVLRSLIGYDSVPIVLFTTSTLPSEAAFANSYNAAFVTKPLRTEQITFIAEELVEFCSDEVKKRINPQKNR